MTIIKTAMDSDEVIAFGLPGEPGDTIHFADGVIWHRPKDGMTNEEWQRRIEAASEVVTIKNA